MIGSEPKAKGIFISTGVVLCFSISLFFGYAIATVSYLMPVVLIESYGWYFLHLNEEQSSDRLIQPISGLPRDTVWW